MQYITTKKQKSVYVIIFYSAHSTLNIQLN
jgi:hypothetical protein